MTDFELYQDLLRGLPGVKSYQLVEAEHHQDRGFDGRLRLRTEAGDQNLLIQIFRSHLSHKSADHIVAAAKRAAEPVLVLAPHIGAGLAAKFAAARVNYLDARGNCHIAAPPLYVHVEGKTGERQPRSDKGLRSAGYQVLFAYLADSTLLDDPIRSVAEMAGVSRQPVADMRHRLLEEGYVLPGKTVTRWHRRRRQDALSMWLHGYETSVRPSLMWGTYRTNDANPTELESRLEQTLTEAGVRFRWGGSAAGFRLTGHYRGERTVIHVRSTPGDFPRRIRALADPRGNLVVMDAFGDINWIAETETVHPLLAYSEMLHEGTERAREAAQDLYEQQIAPQWEKEP